MQKKMFKLRFNFIVSSTFCQKFPFIFRHKFSRLPFGAQGKKSYKHVFDIMHTSLKESSPEPYEWFLIW